MDKEELINKLKELVNEKEDEKNGDTYWTEDSEKDHIIADELLLRYINDKDVTKYYDRIGKWYA